MLQFLKKKTNLFRFINSPKPMFTHFWHSMSVNFGPCTQAILISSHPNLCHVVRQSCLNGFDFASVILISRLKSQRVPIALYYCFIFSNSSKDTFFQLWNVRNFPQLVWLCFPLFNSSTSHLVFARKTSVLRKICGKHVRVCLLLNIVKLPPWQRVTTMWLVLKFMCVPKQNRLTF